jgi:hypothetical protein
MSEPRHKITPEKILTCKVEFEKLVSNFTQPTQTYVDASKRIGCLRQFAPDGFMESLEEELKEKYVNGAIIKISSLPYKIKRCLIKSSRYHGGRDNVMIGAFGEISWTLEESDKSFDKDVDDYIKTCTSLNHVMLLSDEDYDELIDLVKSLYD